MKRLLLTLSLLVITIIPIGCDKDDGPTQPNAWTCGNTIDYGGKTYNTVQIGSQCWLKENLDIGSMIQGSDTAKDNSIIEKYCYDNDTANCNNYGGLYTWDEAMQYTTLPGTRGICQPGWHIPTRTEYATLITTVGGDGNTLKNIGQGSGEGAGTNTSGFSALLVGYIAPATFLQMSHYGYFWSSTETSLHSAFIMYPVYNNNYINLGDYGPKFFGFSIRCLKD
jgi:uncharacterized protein (TIGR02145 family)